MIDRAIRIFIVAGEASGDALGGRLIEALKNEVEGDLILSGVGGEQMEEAGLKSLFPMDELSVMGLVEILPKLRHLLKRVNETAQAIHRFNPDAVITIDSPGFAHQLAKKLGKTTFPKIHYVAPSVWAWKPKRVHKFKKHFDHLLALLPIEPPYFETVGLPCYFVGHSVLESGADQGDGPGFRRAHALKDDDNLLCLLPGSRKGEISRLMPDFEKAIQLFHNEIGGGHIVIPTIAARVSQVKEAVQHWPVQPIIIVNVKEKYDAMAASNVALAASGTVALELALARVPTVIAYRLAPITHYLVRKLVRVDFVHLLNILLGKEVVPERIQNECVPEILANDLINLCNAGGENQLKELEAGLEMLRANGQKTPSQSAASVVNDIINTHIKSY